MSSPLDDQTRSDDTVRPLSAVQHDGVTETHEFDEFETLLGAGEVLKFRVTRESPHEYSGVIKTFVVEASNGGLDAFLDELRDVAGGGLYKLQRVGVPTSRKGRTGFGPIHRVRIAGRPKHYEPPSRYRDDAPREVQSAMVPAPMPYIPRDAPPEMYELVRDLVARHQDGGLSKDDLATAIRAAFETYAPAQAKRGLGEIAEALREFQNLQAIMQGFAPPEPVRGGEQVSEWVVAIRELAPVAPLLLGGLRKLLQPAVASPVGAPSVQPTVSQARPVASGWDGMGAPAPAAASARAQSPKGASHVQGNAQERPQDPSGDVAPGPSPETSSVSRGKCEDDDQDSAEDEEQGEFLTPDEIVSEFKGCSDNEQIDILAGICQTYDPSIDATQIRALLSQLKETASVPTDATAISDGADS